MSFDTKKFIKTKFTHRTEDVPVPDLKDFFAPGEAPVWKVRGLTGQELGKVNEAVERGKDMASIISAVTSRVDKEVTDAVKTLIGLGKDVSSDIQKRIEHLMAGSVDPVCTQDIAVRLCEAFPIEFFQITNAIVRLTGQGQVPGKQQPSGGAVTSEPALPSATLGGVSSTK